MSNSTCSAPWWRTRRWVKGESLRSEKDAGRSSARHRRIGRGAVVVCLGSLVVSAFAPLSAAGAARSPRLSGVGLAVTRQPNVLAAQAAPSSPAGPPAPAPVPPNGTRVSAAVLNVVSWPPSLLRQTLPPVPPDQTLYSLTLDIRSAAPAAPPQESFAQPKMVIEAFSSDPFGSDLVGKQVRATLTLMGDTRGVWWWISDLEVVP